jgi:release factor glutamine methyltransferase
LESGRLEAEILLAHALGCDRVALYTQFDKPLGGAELGSFRELIRRRLAGEPVAYLIGHREFWSTRIDVDSRVLIPRPDTETLVETVLNFFADRQRDLQIVDIGTGSGAIAIALAKEFPRARVIATDISRDAAEVARENCSRLGMGDRVTVCVGPLFEALPQGLRADLLVSNPPYVTSSELETVSAEVRREPVLALDGGSEGLHVIRPLVQGAPTWLSVGGRLVLEHGHTQAAAVALLLREAGFQEVETHPDLAGRPRVTSGLVA